MHVDVGALGERAEASGGVDLQGGGQLRAVGVAGGGQRVAQLDEGGHLAALGGVAPVQGAGGAVDEAALLGGQAVVAADEHVDHGQDELGLGRDGVVGVAGGLQLDVHGVHPVGAAGVHADG